jgi:hypothetical protein
VIYLTETDIYEQPKRIQIKRVPDSDDGVIARFDPDENIVYLAESASAEDSQQYLARIGQILAGE